MALLRLVVQLGQDFDFESATCVVCDAVGKYLYLYFVKWSGVNIMDGLELG